MIEFGTYIKLTKLIVGDNYHGPLLSSPGWSPTKGKCTIDSEFCTNIR